MKTEKWTTNDATEDYPEYHATVTTLHDEPAYTPRDPYRKPHQTSRATYFTRDIWQAAALDCYGLPCIGARILPTGKTEWEFENAEDKAWTTGMEFRSGQLVAPLRDFRSSYRKMMNYADMARREGIYHVDTAA